MSRSPVEITSFLRGLTPQQHRIVQTLRNIVRTAAPAAEETILWRSVWYHRPSLGGRIKGAVCVITPKQDAVQLGFIHGAMLPDPQHQLRGNGKVKRVISIKAPGEIREATIVQLIKSAAEYDPNKTVNHDSL